MAEECPPFSPLNVGFFEVVFVETEANDVLYDVVRTALAAFNCFLQFGEAAQEVA